MIKLVAFYTNDYYYGKSIDLSHSLNRHGVTYEIRKVTGPATWAEAVMYKPRFVLDQLLSSTCERLIYTDVDSQLLRAIPATELNGDISFVHFKRSPHHEDEALTGTLVFKNTLEVRAFCLEWASATEKYQASFTPEQQSFKEVMAHSNLQFQKLGPEWCWIFDDFKEIYPNAPPPIFEHYQASREYKEIEAKGTQEAPSNQGGYSASQYVRDAGTEWKRTRQSR